MLLFIATDIFMLAIGAVLYLMVRALPRVSEDASDRQGLLDRWAHSEVPEKIDAVMDAFLLKMVRKLKVFILKIDNALSRHLRKINADEGSAKAVADFGDFVSGQTVEQ